jgi:hypothetical protein
MPDFSSNYSLSVSTIPAPTSSVSRCVLRKADMTFPQTGSSPRWHRSMALLCDAIRASDEAYIFDNSTSGIIESAPRLVFTWRYIEELSTVTHREFPPIPGWVQRYVMEPLRKGKWRRE